MNAPTAAHRDDGEPDLNALAAFVDGTIAAADRSALIAHLAGCERCRVIAAELARAPRAAGSRFSRPALAIAASIAIAAISGGAYLLVLNRQPPPSPPSTEATPSHAAPPAAASPAKETPSAPSAAAPAAPPHERTRAAGTTTVHGKTFRLVAGEWIDTTYREADFPPAVDITSPSGLAARPALRPFASLGSRFTVVINGTVYRVSIP
ncbi:MAG: zf-HC2 domain-containing protein [Vicinamibacterales bacterium]